MSIKVLLWGYVLPRYMMDGRYHLAIVVAATTLF